MSAVADLNLPNLVPERPADAAAVEALVLAAFGPGRFAKTAERIREQAALKAGLAAWVDDRLVGSVRLWAVAVGDTPALFLGPIAVDDRHRGSGLGAALVAACVETARKKDVPGVLLIGDRAYFERFGFEPAPGARMPGPADPRRVMWLSITQPAPTGDIRPAV